MKKIIFGIITGIILCGGIVYATSYYAKDVSYEPSDASWDVSNVNEALNELYELTDTTNIEVRYAETTDVYGSQTLTFDFSDLPNKEELTAEDFITSPSPGRTGFMIPYSNTYTNKALSCTNTYDKETGILTMNLSMITIDSTTNAILYVPKAYAIYIK